MISFIKFFMQMSIPENMSPKKFIIYLIVGVAIFWIFIFYVSYTVKKEKIEEYKKIEQEVKNQNLNVKQNVEIIKKRSNNLNINDRKRLLEKMFSE